jgi:hypothetical protein
VEKILFDNFSQSNILPTNTEIMLEKLTTGKVLLRFLMLGFMICTAICLADADIQVINPDRLEQATLFGLFTFLLWKLSE